jgi:hypothetical protein
MSSSSRSTDQSAGQKGTLARPDAPNQTSQPIPPGVRTTLSVLAAIHSEIAAAGISRTNAGPRHSEHVITHLAPDDNKPTGMVTELPRAV